jgi:hypothetical protein
LCFKLGRTEAASQMIEWQSEHLTRIQDQRQRQRAKSLSYETPKERHLRHTIQTSAEIRTSVMKASLNQGHNQGFKRSSWEHFVLDWSSRLCNLTRHPLTLLLGRYYHSRSIRGQHSVTPETFGVFALCIRSRRSNAQPLLKSQGSLFAVFFRFQGVLTAQKGERPTYAKVLQNFQKVRCSLYTLTTSSLVSSI